MKVALVHDWLTGMRGGEKVLESLCRLWPQAPIYTLVWRRGAVSAEIEAHPIRTSFVQRLPGGVRRYRWYLPLFPLAIEQMDLRGYDLVISVSHCVAKGALTPAGTRHVSYILTPMRYAWDQYRSYFGGGAGGRWARGAAALPLHYLRLWDVVSAARPDRLLAISRTVAARVEKHYRRPALVISPPVECAAYPLGEGEGDHYLVVSSLVPYKRIDLAIRACLVLERRLSVVGSGPELRALRRLAAGSPLIEFRGWCSQAEVAEEYGRARALLFPGEEDFGIAPLEALSSGCPVVAYGRGGALETLAERGLRSLRPGEGPVVASGGVLVVEQSVEALVEGMVLLEKASFDRGALRARALQYDEPLFRERFLRAVESVLSQDGGGA